MNPILQVNQLVKRYGDLTAVKGISFEVQEGEIFSLLGPNGAGKTTTISVLSTLFPPSEGDALIAGHSVVREPYAVRRVIGIVPQEIALYEDLTARENLQFWGQLYGLSGRELKERCEEVLEQTGLQEKANQRVKTFSGGMKRRLNIGVGLLHRPRLLFMDEPTVGIDPQSRRAILDTVKDLNRQAGMTILYTTHYMEEAQELSHRVGIIDHGEMIAIGTQAELVKRIGQRETLVLQFGEDQSAAAIIPQLEPMSGVQQVVAENHSLQVLVNDAEEILPAVIQVCTAENLKVRTIQIQEPNLEAVFLQLTGRALRD
ncbi:ATP-binding cassette domain-containing protein [Bellilinea sp.]|uniref:ATP-binding cassette domain-containing protein n=1 Tax=Bellilinea sp. TaxID=2838785 RepID=UPI002ADE86FF|nr:ATP-binding cassette domain-containing protein [Bellilinea sp.]